MALQEVDIVIKYNKTAEHFNGHSEFLIYKKKSYMKIVHNSVKWCLGVALGTCCSIVDKALTAIYDVLKCF